MPIHRSAIAFARGARGGCAQDAEAFAGEHGIEGVGELAVTIPDQEREARHAIAEVHQEVACLLGDPGSAGVRRDAEKVNAAGGPSPRTIGVSGLGVVSPHDGELVRVSTVKRERATRSEV